MNTRLSFTGHPVYWKIFLQKQDQSRRKKFHKWNHTCEIVCKCSNRISRNDVLTWSHMISHFFSLSYCFRSFALSGGRSIEAWNREKDRDFTLMLERNTRAGFPFPFFLFFTRNCKPPSAIYTFEYLIMLVKIRNINMLLIRSRDMFRVANAANLRKLARS